MSRAWINFWLDSLLLILFSALLVVSVIVRFIFPPAIYTQHWELWSLSFNDWCNVQFGFIAALATGILLHVMLHWSWVCGLLAARLKNDKKAKIDDGLQTIYGVAFLIVLLTLLGGILAAAKLTIVPAAV
jgi:hypothetical protein